MKRMAIVSLPFLFVNNELTNYTDPAVRHVVQSHTMSDGGSQCRVEQVRLIDR